jgi:uncharacterized protein YaiI (UPF0178 family)
MKAKIEKKNTEPKGEKKLTAADKKRFVKELSKEANRNIALRSLKDLVVGR